MAKSPSEATQRCNPEDNSRRIWLMAIFVSVLLHLVGVGLWRYWLILVPPTLSVDAPTSRDRVLPVQFIEIAAKPALSPPQQATGATKTKPPQSQSAPRTPTPVTAKQPSPQTPFPQPTSSPTQPRSTRRASPSQNPKPQAPSSAKKTTQSTSQPKQPTPSPTPTPAEAKPTATPSPTPTPTEAKPTATPSPTPTPAEAKPTATPTATPTPAEAKPTATPTATPSPTPTPQTSSSFIVQVGEMRRGWTGDVVTQIARLKEKEKQLERINYLTPLGIELDGMVSLEAVVVIETDGTPTVHAELTKVLQGNLTSEQAGKLARAILEQWQFEPTYMEDQAVVQDYTIQLTLRPVLP
jgi:hypothetical protein